MMTESNQHTTRTRKWNAAEGFLLFFIRFDVYLDPVERGLTREAA
jgi:hypothetical protein